MKEVKLYKVEFNEYTNCMNDTISTKVGGNDYDYIYINIPCGGLIIKEDKFEYYKNFGGGFKKLEFVGSMLENE